eukprot:NODE_25_length_41203_cov_0.917113.p14 type:complete len:274 gc:universal NODE_25_length_41203_cov_0.917113:16280-17101(+)
MERFFGQKRSSKFERDDDYTPENNVKHNKKYKTRSSERQQEKKCFENQISCAIFELLPEDLRYILSQHSYKCAYLFGFYDQLSQFRNKPLKITLLLYRQIIRCCQPILTFWFDGYWQILINHDSKTSTLMKFQNENSFRSGLLEILLKKVILVTNDMIYCSYKYEIELHPTLKPFKILTFDPKFDEMDIFELIELYLNFVNSFEPFKEPKISFAYHTYTEHSEFQNISYQWILLGNSFFKVCKYFDGKFYICEYGDKKSIGEKDFSYNWKRRN